MEPLSRSAAAQELLRSIPLRLRKSGMQKISDGSALLTTGAAFALPETRRDIQTTGVEQSTAQRFREQLLQGRLLSGKVVELCATGPSLATSVALGACRFAQLESRRQTGQTAWCAFVDPCRTLYAPGVHFQGVDLRRLLVIRPSEDDLSRVALRLVESQIFPLVVLDLMPLPGSSAEFSLASWVRVVRRLTLALENTENTVVLLTEKNARHQMGLPVAQRIELSRASMQEMQLCISKNLRGEFLPPTRVRWERTTQQGGSMDSNPDPQRWSHAG